MKEKRQGSEWVMVLSVAFALGGCSLLPEVRPADRIVIASWNVENLFDEVDDGDEYPEFDPQRGWTRAQFWGRCRSLATVLRTLVPGGADVLVLEEVEGAHALEVLNDRFLGDLGYQFQFLAPATVPGIKTAILSRYPLIRTGLFFPSNGELRPLVEVELDLGGRSLVVIGNHWKSRIPTPEATEALRTQSAVLLRHRLATLAQRADAPLVVALGDFNTSLELSRPWPNRAFAPGSANAEIGLRVYAGRAAAERSPFDDAVWDPWETVDAPGSYCYHGDWDRLDHALLAVRGLRFGDWGFGGFQVAAYAPTPQAWGPRTPDGVSDHFPLVLTLVRRGASESP